MPPFPVRRAAASSPRMLVAARRRSQSIGRALSRAHGHGFRTGFVRHDADGSHHLRSVGRPGLRGVGAAVVLGRRLAGRPAVASADRKSKKSTLMQIQNKDHLRRRGAQPRQGPPPAQQEEDGSSLSLHRRVISTLPVLRFQCHVVVSASLAARLVRAAGPEHPRARRDVRPEKLPEAPCEQRVSQACRVQFCGSFGGSISSHAPSAMRGQECSALCILLSGPHIVR